MYNIQEETKLNIKNRFKEAIEPNCIGMREAIIFTKEKMISGIIFGDNEYN